MGAWYVWDSHLHTIVRADLPPMPATNESPMAGGEAESGPACLTTLHSRGIRAVRLRLARERQRAAAGDGFATLGIDGFVRAVAYGGHCGRGRGMGMGVSVCRASHQLASQSHLVLILTFGVDYGQAGTTIMGSWAAGAQKAPWSHGRFKGC